MYVYKKNVYMYGRSLSFYTGMCCRDLFFFCFVSGISQETITERFGEIFWEFCLNAGYLSMLRTLGGNLKDFFNTMDGLHEHLLFIFPGMRPPSFRAVEADDGLGLELYYYSERIGLEIFVVGMVKAIAREMFNTKVNVQLCSHIGENSPWAKLLITLDDVKDMHTLFCIDKEVQKVEEELKLITLSSRISSETFCRACAFHVIFDDKMVIYQSGISMSRVIPSIRVGHSKFSDIFERVRPHIQLTFDSIVQYINKIFIVRTREGLLDSATLTTVAEDDVRASDLPTMRFRGQMVYLPECESIMFICSPSVVNLDGLNEKG